MLNDDPVAAGTKLQLPVYAHAARERWARKRVDPLLASLVTLIDPDGVGPGGAGSS